MPKIHRIITAEKIAFMGRYYRTFSMPWKTIPIPARPVPDKDRRRFDRDGGDRYGTC